MLPWKLILEQRSLLKGVRQVIYFYELLGLTLCPSCSMSNARKSSKYFVSLLKLEHCISKLFQNRLAWYDDFVVTSFGLAFLIQTARNQITVDCKYRCNVKFWWCDSLRLLKNLLIALRHKCWLHTLFPCERGSLTSWDRNVTAGLCPCKFQPSWDPQDARPRELL
jgi:hypothetical protein